MTMGFFSANIENKEFQEALFGGEIDSKQTPYHLMEEALRNIREGMFFDTEKISDIINNPDTLSEIVIPTIQIQNALKSFNACRARLPKLNSNARLTTFCHQMVSWVADKWRTSVRN